MIPHENLSKFEIQIFSQKSDFSLTPFMDAPKLKKDLSGSPKTHIHPDIKYGNLRENIHLLFHLVSKSFRKPFAFVVWIMNQTKGFINVSGDIHLCFDECFLRILYGKSYRNFLGSIFWLERKNNGSKKLSLEVNERLIAIGTGPHVVFNSPFDPITLQRLINVFLQ